MKPRVAVLTASLPERSSLLAECRASVAAQTVQVEHLVYVDTAREGPSTVRNRLAQTTDAEWLLPLDDDDLLDPHCVETLLDRASADIVYPWTRMTGRTDGWVPNKLFSANALFQMNYIPNAALIKRDDFLMLGGYRKVPLEDWDLWRRAYLHGLTFQCVAEVLWSYRFMGQNTYQDEQVAA